MLEMPNRISFEKPPVVETLLEVEFAAVPGWGVQYLGLFWADIRDRFPRFEQQPAVLAPSPIVQFNIMSMPIRGWFIDPTDTRVVQVQHDRFSYNWRERPSHDRYPKYEILQPEFQREWETFQRFLSRAGLPIPRITVARVVYVNHIPHGQGWETARDLGKIIRLWDEERVPSRLQDIQFASLSTACTLASGNTVRFDVNPGLRAVDNVNVVQLTVTVSRRFRDGLSDVIPWFDQAQSELVRSFVDFTTEDIQSRVWLRKS